MNKIILICSFILLLLLISGCSEKRQDCVDDDAESIILIYEYGKEHTIRECFDYCDNMCFDGLFPSNSWTDKYCAELCKPK